MSARPAPSSDDFSGQNVARDKLSAAKKVVVDIESSIAAFLRAQERDADDLIPIFEAIKEAQRRQQLDLLQREAPGALHRLGGQLAALLNRLSADIHSMAFDIDSLQAGDVHALFNGLSVITGESTGDSLLSRRDLGRLGHALRDITDGLLNHVRKQNMERKQWNNSQLINALNWVSRGLKRQLLSADTPVIRAFFTEALLVMKDWGSSSEDSASAATDAAPLDTRQLGKCMVQVATAMKFNLIDTETPADLLQELVLGLCSGGALDQCNAWEYQTRDSGKKQRVLVPVRPEGAELTNISNTIKDCLHTGLLDIDSPVVQTIISKLCTQMLLIPSKNFAMRAGQRLGNCCNFLREVFEGEQRATVPVRGYQASYEKLCADMLGQIPERMSQILDSDQNEQSIANLISFVKAMDRTRRHDVAVLHAATSSLANALPDLIGEITSVDSIAATLSGLQHFAMRGLIPRETAVALMQPLLDKLEPTGLAVWPAQSSAVLMRAAVYCYRPAAQDQLAVLMQTLLALPQTVTDRLPYVEAADILAAREEGWIARWQPVLHRLLPELPEGTVSTEDLQRAAAQLRTNELAKDNEKPADKPAPEQAAQLPQKATQKHPPATTGEPTKARNIVGMTRVIEPQALQSGGKPVPGKNQSEKTRNSATMPIPASAAIASSPRTNTTGWHTPKRTVRQSAQETVELVPDTAPENSTTLPSTEPKLIADKKPRNASGTSPASGKAASSKKQPAMSSVKAGKPAPAALSKSPDRPQTPAQEWFSLLKQGSRLSDTQIKRLKALLAAHPELAIAVDGKGHQARSALFYAINTGKPVATTMIVNMRGKQNLAATLKQVFDELLFVEDAHVLALEACLDALTAKEQQVLRLELERIYAPGELERTVAGRMVKALKTRGIIADLKPASTQPKLENVPRNKQTAHNETDDSVISFVINIDRGANLPARPLQNESTANTGDTKPNQYTVSQASPMLGNKLDISLTRQAIEGNVNEEKCLPDLPAKGDLSLDGKTMEYTSLMNAAFDNQTELIKLLLDSESAPKQLVMRDYLGRNALMFAVISGATEATRLLLDFRQADGQTNGLADEQATATNSNGVNALMLAAYLGRTECVKLLLELGSAEEQIQQKDEWGNTALKVARDTGHKDIAALIEKFVSSPVFREGRSDLAEDERVIDINININVQI